MINKRWMLVPAVVIAAASCDKKPAVPADGTMPADSMSSRDSLSSADSAALDSAARDSAALTKAPTKAGQAPIIGHDSAFGPIGSIDSNGKLIPNRPTRP